MILLFCTALAGSFSEGVDAWDAGKIDQAIEAWEPIAEAGWGSGRLKFNLGDAYYRRGDLPRAIAYWRAAGVLRPRTSGVSHNLALARGELEGVSTPVSALSLWMQILTPGELGILGLLLVGLGSGGMVRRRSVRGSFVEWLLTVLAGLFLCAVATQGWWSQVQHPVAVVVDGPANVRHTPEASAVVRKVLQPGSEVRVIQVAGDFVLIETGDEERGWLTDGALLRVPR